jgi:hypothetical protein
MQNHRGQDATVETIGFQSNSGPTVPDRIRLDPFYHITAPANLHVN